MSEMVTGLTRGGAPWTPAFVTGLDQRRCIGCGRCFKVCPRQVFDLVDRDELDLGDEGLDEDDGDGFDDDPGMVMALADALDCIGCEACSRVCPKSCLTHAPQAAA
jgi:Nif-specific ferredoxin III